MTPPEEPRGGGLALLLAFVGGALVGGAIAVLLAPRSGAETRRSLAGAAGGTRDLAARLPKALRDASRAAQAAYTAALKDAQPPAP